MLIIAGIALMGVAYKMKDIDINDFTKVKQTSLKSSNNKDKSMEEYCTNDGYEKLI